MLILNVKTLNNTYRLEQDDSGQCRVLSTTNDDFREQVVGQKVYGFPYIGRGFYIESESGVRTSNVVSIEPEVTD